MTALFNLGSPESRDGSEAGFSRNSHNLRFWKNSIQTLRLCSPLRAKNPELQPSGKSLDEKQPTITYLSSSVCDDSERILLEELVTSLDNVLIGADRSTGNWQLCLKMRLMWTAHTYLSWCKSPECRTVNGRIVLAILTALTLSMLFLPLLQTSREQPLLGQQRICTPNGSQHRSLNDCLSSPQGSTTPGSN